MVIPKESEAALIDVSLSVYRIPRFTDKGRQDQ